MIDPNLNDEDKQKIWDLADKIMTFAVETVAPNSDVITLSDAALAGLALGVAASQLEKNVISLAIDESLKDA